MSDKSWREVQIDRSLSELRIATKDGNRIGMASRATHAVVYALLEIADAIRSRP